MTSFDWQTFLTRYGIGYADHGPNVGKDHIATHCPYCGHSDEGQHMSISLNGRGWHCWRDSTHSGISPTRLVAAMLGVSWSDAASITGTGKGYQSMPPVPANSLVDAVNDLMRPHAPTKPPPPIAFPTSAKPLNSLSRTAIPYQLYMRGRGITDLSHLDRWDILYDHRDERFHGRILFGVRDKGKLVALTARAVGHRLQPRYLAEGPVDQHLIWADRMPAKADTLVLCEGPFDALKVNILGSEQHGIWATCCMTSSFSPMQRAKLYALIPRFKRTVVLFDRGNEANAYGLSQSFPGRMLVATLPPHAKDPAELEDLDFLIEPREEDGCD